MAISIPLPRDVLDPAGAVREELRVSAACPLLFLRGGGGRDTEGTREIVSSPWVSRTQSHTEA